MIRQMIRLYQPVEVSPGHPPTISMPCAPWEAPYVPPTPPPAPTHTARQKLAVAGVKRPSSGVVGIVWHIGKKLWQVSIGAGQSTSVYIGLFDSLEDAKAALLAAKAAKR